MEANRRNNLHSQPVRVLLVDDSSVLRRALRILLENHDCQVCGEAASGREALAKLTAVSPDVVVLDYQMPVMNGLEVATEMQKKAPNIPILMVSTFLTPQLSETAQKVGVKGTCSKEDIDCLVLAVETVATDGTYFRES
jgi:DNA-binding NarL/FixJ family response regulator